MYIFLLQMRILQSAELKLPVLICFSDAVIKHCDQGNLEKEEFIWTYSSRGIRIHHGVCVGGVCGRKQLEQKVERSHLQA